MPNTAGAGHDDESAVSLRQRRQIKTPSFCGLNISEDIMHRSKLRIGIEGPVFGGLAGAGRALISKQNWRSLPNGLTSLGPCPHSAEADVTTPWWVVRI